jgi:hypothetical protein
MTDVDPFGGGRRPFWPWDPAGLWRAWWPTLPASSPLPANAAGARGPLSGDVTQAFEASWFRSLGDQLGFININTARAGDPELERRITEQVASYGRQLGRVLDALDVLIRRQDRSDLSEDARRALDQLQEMRGEIEAMKATAAADKVDRLVAGVRELRRDPDANRDSLRRLREALDEGGS